MKTFQLTGHDRPISFIKMNADGDLLFTCGKEGKVLCWLLNDNKVSFFGSFSFIEERDKAVSCCDVTLDSQFLLIVRADGKWCVYDVMSGRLEFSQMTGGPIRFAEWNRCPGKQTKLVLVNDTIERDQLKSFNIYEMVTDEDKLNFELKLTIPNSEGKCTRVHWGPLDKTIIAGFDNGTIVVYDAITGDKLRSENAHYGPVSNLDFSADRLLMLSSSSCEEATDRCKLWDSTKLKCISTFNSDRPLNCGAMFPTWNSKKSRRFVFVAGGVTAKMAAHESTKMSQFEVQVYDLITTSYCGSFNFTSSQSAINHLAIFPDGSGLACGFEQGTVIVTMFDEYDLDQFNIDSSHH